jgi:hypothetical protein
MSTAAEKRQAFIRYYKRQTGATEVTMREVAALAKKMGWKMPVPPDPLEMLAKQFSDAAGEETRTDKETKRVYKANLAITERRSGKQMTFWIDVDDNPPRHRMQKGLHLYREQMVGEAIIGKNTADHWNSNNPDQMPLPFETDLTDDVNWRLNAPVEETSGKTA